MNVRKLENNQKVALAVGTLDAINLTTIFTTFLQSTLLNFLQTIGHYFMFPIAAAAGIAQAVLAWREAKLKQGDKSSVVRAVVETGAALAVGAAVIGGLVAAPIMGAIAPIIFTATMGGKFLFHTGSAIYYGVKSAVEKNPIKKTEYRAKAVANTIASSVLALVTPAVVLVMIIAKPIFAILGVIAGAISSAFTGYNLFKSFKSSKHTETPTAYQPLADNDNKTAIKKMSTANIKTLVHTNENNANNKRITQTQMALPRSYTLPARLIAESHLNPAQSGLFKHNHAVRAVNLRVDAAEVKLSA